MRLFRSLAPLTAALTLLLCLPYEALPHARVHHETSHDASRARADLYGAELFGAECRTQVHGSWVVAYCHNPYAVTDRVGLHIKCDHWWDLDTDTASVDAGPARTVRLTGRCWKDVRTAWISHQRG